MKRTLVLVLYFDKEQIRLNKRKDYENSSDVHGKKKTKSFGKGIEI